MENILNRLALMPLNLQFFAEPAEPPAEPPADPPVPPAEPPKPADLNALLKGDAKLQSQFDKLVTKALETGKANWEREKNLTADQLAEQKVKEREETLARREQELARSERRANAIGKLGEKQLPTSLIDCIALDDDDTMAASLESAEKAFRASVDAAVQAKLKGGAPKDPEPSPDAAYLAKVSRMMGIKQS